MTASLFFLNIGIYTFISKDPRHVRAIAIGFILSSVAYVVNPMIPVKSGALHVLLIIIDNLTPILAILWAWVVFEDGVRIPIWLQILTVLCVALSVAMPFTILNDMTAASLGLTYTFLCAICTIYVVQRSRKNDLLEKRLHIRKLVATLIAATMMVTSIFGAAPYFGFNIPGGDLPLLWIFFSTFVFNLLAMKYYPDFRFVGDNKELVIPKDVSDPMIETLLARMRDERLYADHDLRVGSLADILGIPEYQLRKKINQSLGYRNFNQFVNRYRIEEASEMLITNSRAPVLTIALEVGFRSISSFNTTFQSQYGVSPTKYRAQATLE